MTQSVDGGIPLPPGFARLRRSHPCPAARGLQTDIKKAQPSKLVALFCYRFAEEEGFEPPERCRSTVFKTAAIDHSAIPPGRTDCVRTANIDKNDFPPK